MVSARLEDSAREALHKRDIGFDPAGLSFAVDFLRLAIRALPRTELGPEAKAVLARAIRARAGLQDQAIDTLFSLAISAKFRSAMTESDFMAFESRFGGEAGSILREEERQELDLEGFVARHGTGEALLLLDVMFEICAVDGPIDGAELRDLRGAAHRLGVDEVLVSVLLQKHDPRHAAGELRFDLTGKNQLIIGRAGTCDATLPDPRVALRHAELLRVDEGWRVVDLASGRPTMVGGVPVTSAPVGDAEVGVGPYALHIESDELVVRGDRSFSALSVHGLHREVGNRSLLHDVGFSVFSGEVVALVGPSGAGKTTLLNAINGVTPADSGGVVLDGQGFHELLSRDRSMMGVVPQDDLVHPELTVEESLRYSGRLRLGDDVSNTELQGLVDRVLSELDIDHIRKGRIGDALRRGISGGQRKRVNLGQELMSPSTRILFLDEPTSGLDPRAAQDIVALVRHLADAGRIVFLVTHDLSPQVMNQVDHLLVLVPGGHLAYFGPPAEACAYFEVPTPDAIFNRLGSREPADWGTRYTQSTDHRKYVATREYLLGSGRLASPEAQEQRPTRRSPFVELWALIRRYTTVKNRDRNGMFVLGIQPPILAAVIWVVFPAPTPGLIFMLSLCCLWFGMSAAVRELISDRVIWRRERRIGVRVWTYLTSKVAVLGGIVALQCILLTLLVFWGAGLGHEDYGFSWPLMGGVTVLTGWAGMALGLLVSASWRSSEAAVGTLPLLLIPQMTFSSMLVSLRDMGWVSKAITWITVERFAFDGLLKTGEYLDKPSRVPGEFDRRAITGPLYELGFKPAAADDMGLSLVALCSITAAFGLGFLVVTTILVSRRR